MNPFEAYNLRKLAENLEAAKYIQEVQRREFLENEAKHMVYVLFELHGGDLESIKQALQGEKELLQELNLQDVVNSEYLRHKAKREIYSTEAHRNFWSFIAKCESAHYLVSSLLQKHEGNIADAKNELITHTDKIKTHGIAEHVRTEWSRQIKVSA